MENPLVNLPMPTPAVEIGCVGFYLLLASLSISRFFYGYKKMTRKRAFHLIMAMFALTRSASILVTKQSFVRNILNRLAVCVLFTVILFHVLFWLDIVNPKVSKLSRRIWKAFTIANVIFYACVLFIGLAERQNPDSIWFGVVPVLIIALGSFITSVGFLYSSCKMHERVARLLKQSSNKKLDHHVQLKLYRALRLMNLVMGVCAVAFLMRTMLYVQRPFSHKECGSIQNPDICLLVGYVLPELVPCALLLILMWEVEPKLWLTSRKPDETIAERVPLLTDDYLPNSPNQMGFSHWGKRSSSKVDHQRGKSRCLSQMRSIPTNSLANRGVKNGSRHEVGSTVPLVWFSFQCSNLKFPTDSESTLLMLQSIKQTSDGEVVTQLGKTEIVREGKNPCYKVMLAAPIKSDTYDSSISFKVLLYVITNVARIEDMDSQWLLGEAIVDQCILSDRINHDGRCCYGGAVLLPLKNPLSRTVSVGMLIMRAEMDVVGVPDGVAIIDHSLERPNKITRAFACFNEGGERMLVEEDLVESPYTWEIPYQLLQLMLVDFEAKVEAFQNGEACPEPLTFSRSHALSSVDSDDDFMRSSEEVDLESDKIANKAGIFDEMIFQIREDVQERKEKKWRSQLFDKMENYLNVLKGCFEKYGSSQHGGLTFKPSTMKTDAELRFLALNLHQQLMTVGSAIPASPDDVECTSSARYSFLMQLMTQQHCGPSAALQPSVEEDSSSEVDHFAQDDQFDDSYQVCRVDAAKESSEYSGGLTADDTLEPKEALRKRVISFDSAEKIVSGAQKVPQKQQKLAASVVALGATYVTHGSGCLSPPPTSPPGPWLQFDESVLTSASNGIDNSDSKPLDHPDLYGAVTVGAFAAHVYGFKRGGIRQLKEQLEKLDIKSQKKLSVPKHSSGLTIYALDREIQDLGLEIEMRMGASFCQAVSALVTSFQQTLYIELHSNRQQDPGRGVRFLEQLSNVGFLFSVESLLSTYGKESGMIGDMDSAVKELSRVQFKLKQVHSAAEAAYKVAISTEATGVVIELPIICLDPAVDEHTSMHRVLGQDLESGAVYLNGVKLPERLISGNNGIRTIPILFTQGVNEMQTVANTVGRSSLQKEINMENFDILKEYANNYCIFMKKYQSEEASAEMEARLQATLTDVSLKIQRNNRGKCVDILALTSDLAREMHAGRVTCCKSAKDRSSMSVTLEESRILRQQHDAPKSEMVSFTQTLRSHGVRRENARKNIGTAQYCFSSIQNYLLPHQYQCPPGTGGGSQIHT